MTKRLRAVLVTFALLVMGSVGMVVYPATAATGDPASESAQFLALLNQLRGQQGVRPLVVDGRLVTMAQGWSNHMAATNTLSHNPDLTKQAPQDWRMLGENVGVGGTVQQLHDAFVASPHHYENMIEPTFNAVGIAVTHDASGRIWVTVDFENSPSAPTSGQAVAAQAPPDHPVSSGYWLVARDGGVFSYGTAGFRGSTGNIRLNQPIVGMTPIKASGGYWFVAADGGVFAFDAPFLGSTGNIRLNQPIVGMTATPSGHGYWLVARDGGIFAFGDAGFYGSTGNIALSQPITGIASTPSGLGYWLVAADGGVFAFGDATFQGSAAAAHPGAPITGVASTASGKGYWMVAADGGVFAFGDARFYGSGAGASPTSPVVSISRSRGGNGYRMVAANGSVFAFGDAEFAGSPAGSRLNQPVVGMAAD